MRTMLPTRARRQATIAGALAFLVMLGAAPPSTEDKKPDAQRSVEPFAIRTFLMHVRKRELPFVVGMGDVIVIPDTTNDRHAHSVPHRTGNSGRRISVTLRGFSSDAALHKPPRTG